MTNPSPRRDGVTLLELALVLLIMSLLAVGAMSYYQGSREYAARTKALEDMNTIRSAVQLFRAEPFNTERRRPARAKELVASFWSGTKSVLVQQGDARVEEEQRVTVKRSFLDELRKTPWGLDYNIDLYNVIAWNTDRRIEKRGPVYGERLVVPYSNVNVENFEASPSPEAWEFALAGGAAWYWYTGAVELLAPHDGGPNDAALLWFKRDIPLKGLDPETNYAPGADYGVRLMDVKWGSVVTLSFDYEQIRTTDESSLDDVAVGADAEARYQRTILERAIDYDPAVAEKEKVGAVLFWPKSRTPATLGAPTDADAQPLIGIRFSDREWEILPNARVIYPAQPPPGSTGQWGPLERHEVKFISKYDEVRDAHYLDVIIDGDFKESIVFPPGGERAFRLGVSPDLFTDAARAVDCRMILHSVSVSGHDFSKHYPAVLWPDANTYGRR